MQKRTRAENDKHGRPQEKHHRNGQLGAELVSPFLKLGNTLPPEVDGDGPQSLAQRRSILQALADHNPEAAKSLRSGPQFLECVGAIRQNPEIIEKTMQNPG